MEQVEANNEANEAEIHINEENLTIKEEKKR